MTHDDDTSYVSMFANGFPNVRQAFNTDWPGPMATYTGSVFTLGMRQRYRFVNSAISITRSVFFVNTSGTAGGTAASASGNSATAWTDVGPNSVTNAATYRPGGGSWSAADFGDDKTIFISVLDSDTGGGGLRSDADWTSLWGQIDYIASGGGLVFLLQLAGLGALPFVGAMDFGQFMRYLTWRRLCHPRRTILTGDEVRRAWRELREYRAPRFFLPAL